MGLQTMKINLREFSILLTGAKRVAAVDFALHI